MTQKECTHIVEDLAHEGGFVLVLDTGAAIDAQAEAMLQALHSRSTGGIHSHLATLEEKGAENFMERFYVGYGHKSIGDCGSATVFVEGISMLAAKAIQDWRLYSGQESSTRYIDFSDQVFLNPLDTKEGEVIMEGWRAFYLEAQEPLRIHLREQFPRQNSENEKIYDKAIAARGFDILRSFLPAGATTNVAWRMNLRQFADAFMLLRHHPLAEVRDIADKTERALEKMYPHSFGHERFEKTEQYNATWMEGDYYYVNESAEDFTLLFDAVDRTLLATHKEQLLHRPPKTELPPTIAECGVVGYEFLLDFGSFRDLQRHRAVAQRMPRLVRTHGFAQWYMDALPEELRKKAIEFIHDQEKKIEKIGVDDDVAQYYTAMGYRVPCRVIGDIKALVYLMELRSTRFVHPTLVAQMLKMIDNMKTLFADAGLVIHQDDEPNRFDIRRGEQDIVAK
jgi:thymidylate synthase ThyX